MTEAFGPTTGLAAVNRTKNVSHSPDRFVGREVAAGVIAAVILVGVYVAVVAVMRTVLALGWYVA